MKKGVQKSEFYTAFKELILFFFFFIWMWLKILSCKLQKELLEPGLLPQAHSTQE